MKLGGDNKMRNLKKIAAIVLAATLCLGVSATTFAAGPSQTDVEEPADIYVGATDKNGNDLTGSLTITPEDKMDPAVKEAIQKELTQKVVEDIIAASGITGLPDNKKFDYIGMMDAELENAPDGGITLVFTLTDSAALKEGDVVCVLHQKHDGTWEARKAVVGKDGFTATFDELSPFVVLKVTDAGDRKVEKDGKEVARYSGTTGEPIKAKTSPQTGE